MSYATEWLMSFRYIIKGQDALIKEICDSFKLTRIEGTIIVFLYNNPGKNTAGDIVELRMLSKGNVSQAVESLIQKSFLARKQDAEDRRKIHLSLLPAAEPIIQAVEKKQKEFGCEFFEGLQRKKYACFMR